jgi:hypothetical protein
MAAADQPDPRERALNRRAVVDRADERRERDSMRLQTAAKVAARAQRARRILSRRAA